MKKRELIQGFMEYLRGRDMKPYFLVNLGYPIGGLPDEILKRGTDHVILNMSLTASGHISTNDEEYTADLRFDGIARTVYIPWDAIEVVYAPENSGPKLIFGPDTPPPKAANKPTLKVVK
jgi:stringent starvation protein B